MEPCYWQVMAIGPLADPIKSHREGALIDIRLRPGSSRRKVEGITSERVAVSIHSHPVGGKANQELLKVLAEALGLPPSHLDIVKGHKSRNKTILARGISVDKARTQLIDT